MQSLIRKSAIGRKTALILIAAILLLLNGGVTATLASNKSVVVTNNTTYTMTAFYASSSSTTKWDTTVNLFAGQTLVPGATVTIPIVDSLDDVCTYDLMAILQGANQAAYTYSVNVCSSNGGTWTINASSQPGA